jgi:hypothetical protein
MSIPYTNPWNLAVPPTTDLAKNIAVDMRAIKQDIQDRMNDQFVVDWSKQPIVPQPQILGNSNGKTIMMAGAQFSPNFSTSAYGDATKQSVTLNSSGITTIGGSSGVTAQPPNLFCTLPIPNGVTVISFGFIVTNSNVPASCRLWILDGNFPAGTTVSQTITLPASAPPAVSLQGAVTTVPSTGLSAYTLEVFTSSSGQGINYTLLAGFLVYNTPNCLNTI